jgi:hypothetical protein
VSTVRYPIPERIFDYVSTVRSARRLARQEAGGVRRFACG